METKSIMIVGVGGQGSLLASRLLGNVLLAQGYDVKVSEVHGMSQRGGSVVTYVKYGEKVYAPNIGEGEADIIVAFEKVEALRALPYLKKGGSIVMDEREIYSMPVLTGDAAYPHDAEKELTELVGKVTVIPASKIAEELGSIKAQNICLLGALVKQLGLTETDWEKLISESVPAKTIDINLAAFKRGYEYV